MKKKHTDTVQEINVGFFSVFEGKKTQVNRSFFFQNFFRLEIIRRIINDERNKTYKIKDMMKRWKRLIKERHTDTQTQKPLKCCK